MIAEAVPENQAGSADTIATIVGEYLGGKLAYWSAYGHPEIMGVRQWKCPSEANDCFDEDGNRTRRRSLKHF